MKTSGLYNALQEKWASERSLTCVPFFKKMEDLRQKKILSQSEFEFAKKFLLTYDGSRIVDDYDKSFLDAVPILRGASPKGMITEDFYHKAVIMTLSMKKDIFLAQLLYVGLIQESDYIKSERSRLVRLLQENDCPTFGICPPTQVAIVLGVQYGFYMVESEISSLKQRIVMERDGYRFILQRKTNFFGSSKVSITDEQNTNYTYAQLITKLKGIYGTL